MKIALLCSGLGHVARGHEVFARGLFDLLRDHVDITLFKGGGAAAERELVVPNLPRYSACLDHIHVASSPRWAGAVREQERTRIEHETFAYAALPALIADDYDVVHCLEQEVCNIIYANRHLFRKLPKLLFSNGGAIPARELPNCDFVQEHTAHNLRFSASSKAFMIPHGVDVDKFRPGVSSDFRARHRIPTDAMLALSVGTICVNHKRMDHVIRELAPLPGMYLAMVGQENAESAAIRALAAEKMGDRVVFTTMAHDALPQAYAAADIFVLGSLFETFGIVYIEAMAAGLPVVCTKHVNQQSIVGAGGLYVDMAQPGALTAAIRDTPRDRFAALGRRARELACAEYDTRLLKQRYVDRYAAMAAHSVTLPGPTMRGRFMANYRNLRRSALDLFVGRAEERRQ